MTESERKRQWYSFSIRDLLLLTVIAALAIGWWLDHRKLTKDHSATFTVYYLRHVDAKSAAITLEKAFYSDTDVQVVSDSKQNALFVRAPSHQLKEIDLILRKLDVPTATQ